MHITGEEYVSPWKPKRVCPRCGRAVSGRCECTPEPRRRADRQRGNANERGYSRQWRYARERYLAEHPLCVDCEAKGRIEAATVVDHIVPHRGNQVLFWDVENWQALCVTHHNEKTARGE